MKKKINAQFITLTVAAIIITIILSTIVNYSLLKKEIVNDLKSYAHALAETGAFRNISDIKKVSKMDNLRITIIKDDGTVVYDTFANVEKMENHYEREEIAETLKKGEGSSVRRSETVDKNTYYYAVRMDNNNILRVSRNASSIVSVFIVSLPGMVALIIILTIVSIIIAHILTKSIIKPIEEMAMDMDHQSAADVYKELRPFVAMIQKQHKDIIKTSQMRQEFTANVSHELKTPLTAISGYAELMENGMASEEDVARFAGEIHQNANRLLTLINDIIRLSELDTSSPDIELEQIDIYAAAQKCVSMLSVNAENHNVSISLSGQHCIMMSNQEMIDELLYNLCDNAIRYNNAGGSVEVTVDYDKDNRSFIEVKDTGIGISREHQERVFERFYRIDKSRSKSTGGTGLGLAIVKHIVARNNADIMLDSEPGRGTTIRITFN